MTDFKQIIEKKLETISQDKQIAWIDGFMEGMNHVESIFVDNKMSETGAEEDEDLHSEIGVTEAYKEMTVKEMQKEMESDFVELEEKGLIDCPECEKQHDENISCLEAGAIRMNV